MFTLVEIPPGATIVDVARSMVALSQKTRETMRAEFQGVCLEANPQTSAEEIVALYSLQHEEQAIKRAVETGCAKLLADEKIRRGEIALLLMRRHFKKDGVRFTPNFRRELGNVANEIGVQHEELTHFVESIVRELVDGLFAPPEEAAHPHHGGDWEGDIPIK